MAGCTSDSSSGGYVVSFRNEVPSRLICPICINVMRDPVQTECGHLFCYTCILPIVESDNSKCPLDRQSISEASIFHDVRCRNEVSKLEVYCKFKKNGCQWMGDLGKLEAHCGSCDLAETSCRYCGNVYLSSFIDEHMTDDCPMFPVTCSVCYNQITRCKIMEHLEITCPMRRRECPLGCNADPMPLKEMIKHLSLTEGTCQLQVIKCPIDGCNFESERRNMLQHCRKNRVNHDIEMNRMILHMSQIAELNYDRMVKLGEKMESTKNSLYVLKMTMAVNKERFQVMENTTNVFMESFPKAYHSLDTKIASLMKLCRRFQKGEIYPCEEEIGVTEYSSEDKVLDEASLLLTKLRIDLKYIEQKCEELQHTSYNGRLVFIVKNFREYLYNLNHCSKVRSDSFYTKRHGYKLCAYLYPIGKRSPFESNMTISVALMRGHADKILKWPFRHTIVVTIVNKDPSKNKTGKIIPDDTSLATFKPTDENCEMSLTRFISHEELDTGGFVNDNSVTITVEVDINSETHHHTNSTLES